MQHHRALTCFSTVFDNPFPPQIPPRFDRWPSTVRSAALLRGSLIACGPGVRGAAWPETPEVRLAALSPWLEGHRIASLQTAAWVWGSSRTPGNPLSVSSRSRGRRRSPRTHFVGVRVHETRYNECDVLRRGVCAVTLPLRTIIDLLFEDQVLTDATIISIRLLVLRLPAGRQLVGSYLSEHRRPYRTRAIERWAQCYSRRETPYALR